MVDVLRQQALTCVQVAASQPLDLDTLKGFVGLVSIQMLPAIEDLVMRQERPRGFDRSHLADGDDERLLQHKLPCMLLGSV